jgi:C-terminal peptidase prc
VAVTLCFFVPTLPSRGEPTNDPKPQAIWELIEKEPCLRPIQETNDIRRATLIYYLHFFHRLGYPLDYFCINGKPAEEKMIFRLMDKYSHVVDLKKGGREEGNGLALGFNYFFKDDHLDVVFVPKHGPAFKAGLRPGDSIVKIKNRKVDSLQQALNLLEMNDSTSVPLTCERQGRPKRISITPELFQWNDVDFFRLSNFGYLRMGETNGMKTIARDILEAAYSEKSFKGLILDLRDSGGGRVNDALYVMGWFLKKGSVAFLETALQFKQFLQPTVVYVETGREDYLSVFRNIPLVVLVNDRTASASEMIAGALQHHRRAPLIGEQTYGKGSTTNTYFTDDRRLTLTLSEWMLPDVTSVEGVGITPDFNIGDFPYNEGYPECQEECFLWEDEGVRTALAYLEANY